MSSPSPFDASRASEQAASSNPNFGRERSRYVVESRIAASAAVTVWALSIFALLMIGAYFVSHLIAGAITL